MKKRYRMSNKDFNAIMEIHRNPAPVMYLSGGIPMGLSTQERANAIWKSMAEHMGFVWDSAGDAGTGDPKDFVAMEAPVASPPKELQGEAR